MRLQSRWKTHRVGQRGRRRVFLRSLLGETGAQNTVDWGTRYTGRVAPGSFVSRWVRRRQRHCFRPAVNVTRTGFETSLLSRFRRIQQFLVVTFCARLIPPFNKQKITPQCCGQQYFLNVQFYTRNKVVINHTSKGVFEMMVSGSGLLRFLQALPRLCLHSLGILPGSRAPDVLPSHDVIFLHVLQLDGPNVLGI